MSAFGGEAEIVINLRCWRRKSKCAVQPCADHHWTCLCQRARLWMSARSRMSKSPSEQALKIDPIDCPRCGARGYLSRQSPSTDKDREVLIYICGECGERIKIATLD